MTPPKTDTNTLADALMIIAKDLTATSYPEGLYFPTLHEAARRLKDLQAENARLTHHHAVLVMLHERIDKALGNPSGPGGGWKETDVLAGKIKAEVDAYRQNDKRLLLIDDRDHGPEDPKEVEL